MPVVIFLHALILNKKAPFRTDTGYRLFIFYCLLFLVRIRSKILR